MAPQLRELRTRESKKMHSSRCPQASQERRSSALLSAMVCLVFLDREECFFMDKGPEGEEGEEAMEGAGGPRKWKGSLKVRLGARAYKLFAAFLSSETDLALF